jgi:hypothetical protein
MANHSPPSAPSWLRWERYWNYSSMLRHISVDWSGHLADRKLRLWALHALRALHAGQDPLFEGLHVALARYQRPPRKSSAVHLLTSMRRHFMAMRQVFREQSNHFALDLARVGLYLASKRGSGRRLRLGVFGLERLSRVLVATKPAGIEAEQVTLALRDLLPSPFYRPRVMYYPQSPTAARLVGSLAYNFDAGALPILADALEEEGYDDRLVLNHLRFPGTHFSGCWALEHFLGWNPLIKHTLRGQESPPEPL